MASPGKRSLYYAQLGQLVNSGLPLLESFGMLEHKSFGSDLARASRTFQSDLIAGKSMLESLESQKRVFSPFERGLLRIGIEGGHLVEQCKLLEEWFIRMRRFHSAIRQQMMFPFGLLILAWIVVHLKLIYVESWEAFFWQGIYPMLAFLAGCLVIYLGLDWKFGEAGLEQGVGVYIPVIGRAIRKLLTARFLRAFASLLEAGLPIDSVLKLSLESIGGGFLRAPVERVANDVEQGELLAPSFARSGIFSPAVVQLLATGEKTGSLPEMAMKATTMLEEEAESSLREAFKVFALLFYLAVVAYIVYEVFVYWSEHVQDVIDSK